MKRRSRTILKQLDGALDEARNGKRLEQERIQRLKKVHLERDEFTEHKELEDVLVSLAMQARQLEDHYQGHRKRMIQTAALELEDRLNKIGKNDLVCHISEELIKVLKRTGINWSPIYLRRCLDERYKNPVNRLNALARKEHPGVPQDTGKTAEELEESLNRKPGWGQEYKVKCNLDRRSVDYLRPIVIERHADTDEYTRRYPVIVTVKPAEQDATVEFDLEEYATMIKTREIDVRPGTTKVSKKPTSQ